MPRHSLLLPVSLGLALVAMGGSLAIARAPVADPPTPATPTAVQRKAIGNGLTLAIDGNAIYVVKGKQRARLEEAIAIKRAVVDKNAKRVVVTVESSSCTMEATYAWTFGFLEAKLANTAAYALHKAKNYKGSAAGFAKAVAADPSWNIAAYNLASAQQLLGDPAAAVKALGPWLASDPIATYVQVTTDPELSPLLARPELSALRAQDAGTVKLTQDALFGLVAYEPDRKLVAIVRTERSWGACTFENRLEIYNASNAAPVASTPLVRWDETSPDCDDTGAGHTLASAKQAIASRVAMLETMLRDLGFKPTTTEVGTDVKFDEAGDKTSSSLVKAKLGVVLKDGVVRVFRGNAEQGMATASERMTKVVYLPELSAVAVFSLRPGAEGCEGTDPTRFTLVTIAPQK